jgi:hypothetical protein
MNSRRHSRFVLLALPLLAVGSLAARDARACGGCFHQPPPPNEVDTAVVTDHRMAFALSTKQTVLWDQIRYSGNPTDFAWVLPVLPGTQVQLSTDAWLAALDATTASVIRAPPMPYCPPKYGSGGASGGGYGGYGGDYSGDQSAGCGCGASTGEGASAGVEADASATVYGAGAADAGPPPPPPVTVTTQETVGPYEVVVLHSTQGQALDAWLTGNGYEIPASIQPILDAYIAQKMDFVAMKLAPGANVNAMQPVRVVEPGADPSLPLRMISAGAGAHVGLALWVISEGRYHPQSFPDVSVDFSKLTYDVGQQRSNYTDLVAAALATQGGRGWLTEFAGPAQLYGASGASTPGLLSAYQKACKPQVPVNPCDAGAVPEAGSTDGSQDAQDEATAAGEGGASDADAVEASADDAASEAGDDASEAAAPDAASPTCVPPTAMSCDDPDVAFAGLHAGSIWITKLVADLPSSALGTDLVLEATSQLEASNVHQATAYVDGDPCTLTTQLLVVGGRAGGPANTADRGCALATQRASNGASTALLVAATALVLAWMRRRGQRAAR